MSRFAEIREILFLRTVFNEAGGSVVENSVRIWMILYYYYIHNTNSSNIWSKNVCSIYSYASSAEVATLQI